MMQDHGGNLDWAITRYGAAMADWIDLSTGINRVPYPLPALSGEMLQRLPTRSDMQTLCDAAARAYQTTAGILPVAGAQAGIQMIPRLGVPGTARVLAPTYNEHAFSLRSAGWNVEEVSSFDRLAGADLAVIVNPNNPDGREVARDALVALACQVGTLVVDESFADGRPDLSLAPVTGRTRGLFVLRSFGKFYGLAGLRLGFVLGHDTDIDALSVMAGPWPVSGPAIEIGRQALVDTAWATKTIQRLNQDVSRMDALAVAAGWDLVGGTALFRLYRTPDAEAAQDHLAKAHIWSRRFPWSDGMLRLGLPGSEAEWSRVSAAFEDIGQSRG